ncbi:MAG: anthranilate synthase component I family protein [Phycisphaeraceae bacterium]|nr:anthranilate synthase component I family protein [Phycisphaerales bacterium]QOJ16981.1 MAG: anthranilate synthase component I family protein [Phycisphaeraceae bacterium]
MTTTLVPSPIASTPALPADPLMVVRRWPVEWPLMALCSGAAHERWGRWTILARPRGWYTHLGGRSDLAGFDPAPPWVRHLTFGHDPLQDVDRLFGISTGGVRAGEAEHDDPGPPFRGGWIGSFGYELGFSIEPTARVDLVKTPSWPLIELAWCPDALVFDHASGRWWMIGEVEAIVDRLVGDLLPSPIGRGAGSKGLSSTAPTHAAPFQVSPLHSSPGGAAFKQAVTRTLEYIRAGDVFQANIAQQYGCDFRGSTRTLFLRAMRTSGARYGALLESAAGRTIVSMSPELFLQIDGASRRIVTRPIKGTRPMEQDAAALAGSGKDAAELHMIVDLMRNDLGRVCSFGSMRVNEARVIETYPTVHHGVAEVSGTLRPGATMGDVLRATFPPGSVTGAPKVRAMQVIDELEPHPRGAYCGAIGFIDVRGGACLNVGIRTIALTGEREPGRCDAFTYAALTYGAGCGVVADSTPDGELAECEQKTAVLRATLTG